MCLAGAMLFVQIVDEIFRLDPSGAVLAFANMMRKQIVMPAHWMDDNEHEASNSRSLFKVRVRCCVSICELWFCCFVSSS